jgi:hypothetical protein
MISRASVLIIVVSIAASVAVIDSRLQASARKAPTYEAACPGRAADEPGGPYDPNPTHIWNRLHRQFFVRTGRNGKEYGAHELDPLLWWETKYLVSGPSHQQAMSLLNEFLSAHAEKLIADPLKRAMLQRDLWAIFDWLSIVDDHRSEREEMQAKLAEAVRRLALSAEQIKRLPDNYAGAIRAKAFATDYQREKPENAFLPAELLQPGSPWVLIGDARGRISAPSHVHSTPFQGRSTFLVFIRLPGGRDASLGYLQELKKFPRPWIYNTGRSRDVEPLVPNPELPQFPVGTQTALVRRLILIDDQGNLTPTNITESAQLRVYRAIPPGTEILEDEARSTQDVFEFALDRQKLFKGEAGGLRAVLPGEKHFSLFRAHGIDWFEKMEDPENLQGLVLSSCATCHASPGIHSFLSFSERRFGASMRTPEFVESTIANEESMTASDKSRRYEWGLLRGMWQAKR